MTGLLLGVALAVPGAYALVRADGPPAQKVELLSALLNAGLGALAEKNPTRALQLFQAANRAFPQNARVHNNICVAFNELGRYAEAMSHCKLAIRLEPDFTLAEHNLHWAESQLHPSSASAGTPRANR